MASASPASDSALIVPTTIPLATAIFASLIHGLAGADEVLVSSTVKDLVAGSTLSFSDRGTHELKGVPG